MTPVITAPTTTPITPNHAAVVSAASGLMGIAPYAGKLCDLRRRLGPPLGHRDVAKAKGSQSAPYFCVRPIEISSSGGLLSASSSALCHVEGRLCTGPPATRMPGGMGLSRGVPDRPAGTVATSLAG